MIIIISHFNLIHKQKLHKMSGNKFLKNLELNNLKIAKFNLSFLENFQALQLEKFIE